jgi:hypothetical protein
MEMYAWIDQHKPKHLTIRDLKKWAVGETKDVIIFDRNFEEYSIWNNFKKNKEYNPTHFFEDNQCKITYNGNLTWDIHYPFGGTACHNIELDIEKLNTGWHWSPLCEEYMILDTTTKNHRITKLPPKDQQKIHWSQFDDDTRIGWRGPIMLWKDVEDDIKIYWTSNVIEDQDI